MDSGLGVPRRLVASVVNSIDAVGELPHFQQRLLEQLDSTTRAIARLEESVELMAALADSMNEKLAESKAVMLRIEQSVATIAERTPDPQAPGPIAKAKEAITGGE
jgi:hypothetical protein